MWRAGASIGYRHAPLKNARHEVVPGSTCHFIEARR